MPNGTFYLVGQTLLMYKQTVMLSAYYQPT
jgi:hypothetical protein